MRQIFITSLLLLIVACTDLKTLENKPADEGLGHNYTADYKTVVKAARAAIPAAGFTLVSETPQDDGRMLLAQSSMEKLRIVVQPDDSDVVVRIISSSLTGNGSADDLFNTIADLLNKR